MSEHSEQGEPDSDGDDRPEPVEEGSDKHLSDEVREQIKRDAEEEAKPGEPGTETVAGQPREAPPGKEGD